MIEALLDSDSDSDVDGPDAVGQLAEQFLALHRQGHAPDIEEYCLGYPEFALRIRNLFPTLLMVEQCGKGSGDNSCTKSEFVGPSCPEQIGDYKIIREVGRGGMGIVYEAEQQSLGRRVALKVLPTSAVLSASTIERFRRESRAAARLHHSNIVPVFGVGEQDGLHYYVMQFIQGVGLDEILLQLADSKRGLLFQGTGSPQQDTQATEASTDPSTLGAKTLSSSGGERHTNGSEDRIYWHRVALIGMQLANALHFAHSQGVLHRDLKPANVMLDTQGIVWLTDFGLAQATNDANLTRSGDIVGTLRYLAPERLRGECSRQSDVYGLGITLYELITFAPAFAENDRATLIRQIVQQDPKRPRSINQNIPRDLETIILKAIEKEATRRYASAGDFADDLSRFLGDRPIRARRVVLVEQAWRWCRRNPMVATLSSVVCLLMLGLTFGWGMFSWIRSDRDRARTAENRAEQARTEANRAEAIAQSRSHLAQAVGYRNGIEPGRKSKVLDEIRQALAFDPPESIRFELRNEAIAALAQTDVKLRRIWEVENGSSSKITFDSQLKRFARVEPTGVVSIVQIESKEVIGQIAPKTVVVERVTWSSHGQFVVLSQTEGGSLEVWDVPRCELLVATRSESAAFAFSPDESTIAVYQYDGHVHFYQLPSGIDHRQIKIDGIASVLAYHPDNKRLAIVLRYAASKVRIVEAESDAVQEFLLDGPVLDCQWHPDGDKLALGLIGGVELWDVPSRSKLSKMIGHSQQVVRVRFNKRGDCLASTSWDGTLRIWDTASGDQIALYTGGAVSHGGHESVLGIRTFNNELQVVELDPPVGHDRLRNGNATGQSQYNCGDTTADGRLLIAGSQNSIEFWDLVDRRLLAKIVQPFTLQMFLDSQQNLLNYFTFPSGMRQVSLQFDGPHCRVGTPAVLGSSPSAAYPDADITPDGQLWAIADNGKARLQRANGEMLREIDIDHSHKNICLSPDGNMLVTHGWHSPKVCVWDAKTGSLIQQFSAFRTQHSFTPDSKQLVTSTGAEYVFRNIADWKIARRIERHDCEYPSGIAFAPSGDLVALELSWGVLHLLRTDSYETVSILKSPKRERLVRFRFIGENNNLFSFHSIAGEIHFWRINELNQRLNQMDLGWQSKSSVVTKEQSDVVRSVPLASEYIKFVSQISDDQSDLETARQKVARFEQRLSSENENNPVIVANNLAWILVTGPVELRDSLRAVSLLEKAAEHTPLNHVTRNTLAIAYYRTGRIAEAEKILRDNLFVTTDSDIAYDLYFLAMCYWQLNKPDEARITLEWAERMFRLKLPTEIESLRELAAFQKEARELIQKGIARD